MRKLIFSLLTVLCTATVFADNHPGPGKFGLTAQYLYLMPTIDDTYFVMYSPVASPSVANGQRMNNDFDFNSGFRVIGAYSFCDCNRSFEIAYSYLNANQSRTVEGQFLYGTIGDADFVSSFENYPGTATSNLNARYYRIDGLYSQGVFNCSDVDIYLLFGVEYADLHFNEHYLYSDNASSLTGVNNQTSYSWGVGPQLGFEVDYALFECNQCVPGTLFFVVNATGSLLSGQTRTRVNDRHLSTGGGLTRFAHFNDQKGWRVIPALHAHIGVGYDMCISKYEGSLEIGYEFSSYFRGFARSSLPDDVAYGLVVTNYNNYDLQGLYVSGSVNF